tara:strand:- start:20 stop:670 length:651 start_codon:yes stop_codon:yes gene_type:complete
VNIILFGPPGAGKGTQSNNISKEFNLHKIATGDLLREEINRKTSLGDEIKSLIDKGLFVSDEIINNLIIKTLADKKYFNRLIFDGYPRNINQAEKLDILMNKYDQKIHCVLNLNVDKNIVIKRILGRQICSNCGLTFNKYLKNSIHDNHKCDKKFLETRTDDNPQTIEKRFDIYTKITLPILEYYRKQNLLREINGMGDINQIYKEILGIISSLDT